jgi:hypothetical protein
MATAADYHLASSADCEMLIAFDSEHLKDVFTFVELSNYEHLPKPSKKYLCLEGLDHLSDFRFVLHSDTPVLSTFNRHGGVLEQLTYYKHLYMRQ